MCVKRCKHRQLFQGWKSKIILNSDSEIIQRNFGAMIMLEETECFKVCCSSGKCSFILSQGRSSYLLTVRAFLYLPSLRATIAFRKCRIILSPTRFWSCCSLGPPCSFRFRFMSLSFMFMSSTTLLSFSPKILAISCKATPFALALWTVSLNKARASLDVTEPNPRETSTSFLSGTVETMILHQTESSEQGRQASSRAVPSAWRAPH